MFDSINIRTSKRNEFINITGPVKDLVKKSSIKNGLCVLHVPHTTAAITINEDSDPDVVSDILGKISELIPKDRNFLHLEGNSDSHIKSTIFGSSLTIIIQDGSIVLGTWQGIYFCEFDGPRNRNIYIKII